MTVTPWSPSRLAAAAAVVVFAGLLAGCANAERPSVQADEVALPAPMRSLTVPAAGAVGQVESALAAIGERLDDTERPYRPSEPSGLLQVPRALIRADLADVDEGYVLVYAPTEVGTAPGLATELATYLESGFGQTNYPADAQFSVATLGETLIFTWWSRSRSSDAARAEAVFDAVATIGEAEEILK